MKVFAEVAFDQEPDDERLGSLRCVFRNVSAASPPADDGRGRTSFERETLPPASSWTLIEPLPFCLPCVEKDPPPRPRIRSPACSATISACVSRGFGSDLPA